MQENMLALGECGMDRSIPTDFALQKMYFKEQIHIAEKYHKPLIIHCVRAYSDLMKFKKESKSDIPWIIHAYRGNQETTLSLIKHGFYFSVGEQLLKDESKHPILRIIPVERLFLETDNREISIKKIYLLAAQILKIDEEVLTEAIFNNFKTLFGDDKLVAKNRIIDWCRRNSKVEKCSCTGSWFRWSWSLCRGTNLSGRRWNHDYC